MEMKIGIRVVSIIGVLLILMGVVLGLNYTFTYLLQSNLIKSIAAYSIGLLLLGGGELSNRRNKNIVSTGLCAGGIAVLFATTAVSYFNLDVLSAPAAVLACVIIAALALLFSIRYDSQLIAIFAVVGGHLPMTALEGTPVMLYSGMVYFLLLNLFVLLLAVKKRWQVLKYFSLILSAQSTSVLIGLEGMRFTVANIAYIAANFLLYMGIILVNPLLNKSLLRASDTVLLALNTLAGCGFIYWVLGRSGQDAFNGLMALGFCVFYFAMAKVLGRLLREDAGTRGLFYATSAAFLALGIPLQLESGLITMGWVIEGVALCAFGIAARRKWYRRCGVVLFSLGAAHFVFIDLMFLWMEGDPLFPWRFGIMAAGASILLATLKITYRDQAFWQGKGTAWVRVFQYAVLLFDWFYLLYMSWYLYRYVVRPNSTLWLQLACFLVTWGWAALMRHLPVLRDKAVRVTGLLLCGLGLFCLFACNFMWYNMFGTPYFGVLHFVALAVFNLLGMAVAWDLLRTITKWNPGFREWWPLLTAVTSLILAVQLIQIHPNVRFGSMLVSFVVLAFAVGLIVLGFARRFSYARRFGLALTLLAVAKLFLFDLVFLESWQRILSYFVFGAALIAISFVYQQFALRLGGPAPGDPPPPKE